MFVYQHKTTKKIVERKTPMPTKQAQDYILVSWVRNMMMKVNRIIKK